MPYAWWQAALGVWGSGPKDVFVVGTLGRILHYPPNRLTTTITNPQWGQVTVEPNQQWFDPNATVTLTATPIPRKAFREWTIYDPNHPGDPNYAVKDANTAITMVMNSDMHVEAAFKCGSALAPMLPLTATALFALRRRVR